VHATTILVTIKEHSKGNKERIVGMEGVMQA